MNNTGDDNLTEITSVPARKQDAETDRESTELRPLLPSPRQGLNAFM